jgi:ATP-dependent Clp protease protease subunit
MKKIFLEIKKRLTMKRIIIGIVLVFVYDVYSSTREAIEEDNKDTTFYLVGRIDEVLAFRFEKAARELSKTPKKPITIIVNSGGGSVIDGLAIINSLKKLKNPITYRINGKAASMAAIIVASGKKGTRFATRDSIIMIHDVSGQIVGRYKDMKASFAYSEKIRKRALAIIALGTKKSFDVIEKDCTNDYYMTATEAIKYGIIDKIY